MDNGFLTINEVSEKLKVSSSWIYKKCKGWDHAPCSDWWNAPFRREGR